MASVLAVIACVVALAAFFQARRAARQLAQLSDMYWQLKYEHGELKAALLPPGEPPPAPSSAFVPIGAVKRNSS